MQFYQQQVGRTRSQKVQHQPERTPWLMLHLVNDLASIFPFCSSASCNEQGSGFSLLEWRI